MTIQRVLAMFLVVCVAAIANAAEQDTRVFELRTYYSPPGKLDDLHARFRDHTMKLFEKHEMTSVGYWVPMENPDNTLIYLLAFPSAEARDKSWKAFLADEAWKRVKKETEADGRIVTKVESVLLGATDYSPEITPSVAERRIFELRTYTATPGKLVHLNARFRDHTLRLFRKHKINNFGYWCPREDAQGAGNTLIYMLSHQNVETRKATFAAFLQDSEWKSVSQKSVVKAGGPLTVRGGVKSVMLQATDYSPTR